MLITQKVNAEGLVILAKVSVRLGPPASTTIRTTTSVFLVQLGRLPQPRRTRLFLRPPCRQRHRLRPQGVPKLYTAHAVVCQFRFCQCAVVMTSMHFVLFFS